MSFQLLSVDVSLGILLFGHLFSLRPSSLDILFSPHLILLTRFSLGTIFLVSCCYTFILRPLSVKIVSFDTFCLDISFVLRPFFIRTSLYFDIILPCEQNSSCVIQDLHKVLPVPKNLSKEFPRTIYLVLQSLHKVLPSTTSYYKARAKYFPVLLRTTISPHPCSLHLYSISNLSTSALSPIV